MKLSTFITEALKEIQAGVKKANGNKELLHIAPGVVFHKYDPAIPDDCPYCIDYITFDMSISEAKEKSGIEVATLSDGNAAQTKVHFRVPFYWGREKFSSKKQSEDETEVKN
jgi:hypothetical protein